MLKNRALTLWFVQISGSFYSHLFLCSILFVCLYFWWQIGSPWACTNLRDVLHRLFFSDCTLLEGFCRSTIPSKILQRFFLFDSSRRTKLLWSYFSPFSSIIKPHVWQGLIYTVFPYEHTLLPETFIAGGPSQIHAKPKLIHFHRRLKCAARIVQASFCVVLQSFITEFSAVFFFLCTQRLIQHPSRRSVTETQSHRICGQVRSIYLPVFSARLL